ncbi:MAG: 2-oxoglutarate dehydrogenase complex dihydrolipoyllysine-residue succinyltransferase [Gammaproteobacteria bacterium]|jgi:2-oxoglutarate dehydrogenase E2 component (dihydrolipoamide succinyltransferase)|nr:2-oxoglutarate dehydrogenase complex dihydrolipoyllysine-residue succinyltransferase [Gammaproteobacteria bacterium]MBT5201900.1 2-oxoglutarate dehydrogenase complex dihydrolipoyllysine-residue succinyltransferase [Gammaproteobacteria bacterium]MBT5602417.1 2-oxoglutarate dehydrogenase complex dihydrolipoyllysine-residue succinyltransferase [Gammaproteobacteria bacterium]MBT6245205.1 2-oxoglutarate dehydrogenase complex dihydrolipoyllysine-residue succinyltransferase [Gammaproteobacteria bact
MEIKAPDFPESIADGEIVQWHVVEQEFVHRDQILVEIETDKVVLEVAAPADGKVTRILKTTGDTILSEDVLAVFEVGADHQTAVDSEDADAVTNEDIAEGATRASPSARKLASERNVAISGVAGTGKGGLVTRGDVLKVAQAQDGTVHPGAPLSQPEPQEPKQPPSKPEPVVKAGDAGRVERRVPMTRLRSSIARRLVEAQQTAAMLTTFNEVDMRAVMELRSKYKEAFAQAHAGVRLGFMSFFVRACVEALKRFPGVNASIDGSDIVYHGYQDIGVAVGSPRGLVVPVLRDADSLGLAEIEERVKVFGDKARDGKLTIEEITGGTFTLSNGGIFGSLLSTPILNPPQTGILGMHKIQERPIAVNGAVVIRPMMYLALSYDHRLIDGQEAVRFLVTVKEFLEDPAKILLDI